MGFHKDVAPTSDPNAGAHVVHYYEFANTTDMNAGTDVQKGAVAFTATDVGRVARVGVAAPYDFYILRNEAGPVWEQINGAGGGGGSGDVVGPASATDNAIARFNGTGGKTIQNSPVTVGDAGEVAGVGHVDLTTGALAAHTEGRIDYDPAERTLIVYNDDPNVTHQLGQEILLRVYNNTGVTLADGSAVYQTGTVQIEAGVGRPEVALAQADVEETAEVIGVVTSDIPDGAYGWVTEVGFVNGLNLTAFSNGDRVYLSETTPGALRVGPPPQDYHTQIGYVVQATASGRLLVQIRAEDRPTSARVLLGDEIGTPAVNTLREFLSRTASPGVFQDGSLITDDGDGTVTVDPGAGLIRATDSDIDPLLSFEWVSTPLTPTDNSLNYVYIEYNGGSPQAVITTTFRTDVNTNLLIGTIYRSGTRLDITNRPVLLASAIRDLHRRLIAVNGLSHADGATLSGTGTRSIAITEGELWLGLDRYDVFVGGFDSNVADTFSRWYRNGVGGWTEETAQTQLPNNLYDDGSGTLAAIATNRYGVFWIYGDVDSDVAAVYGRGSYTLSQALDAGPPSDLPPQLGAGDSEHGLLVGKVIVQEGVTAFHSVESAFTEMFAGSVVTDHGSLSGLADDDHTQYLRVDGTRAMTGALNMGAQAITNVGNVDGVDISAHASRHIAGGADEIDGDQIDIDWNPTNYTPTTAPTEATSVDHLTAHLAGIDTAIGAASAAPTVDTLEGFTTGNRYDSAASGYGGVTTGFVFGALVEVLRLDTAGGQAIWNCVSFGVDGWGLGIESNARFQAYFIDTAGAQVASTAGAADALNDPGGAFMSSKLFLLMGQVVQNGANNDVYLWVNGQKLPVGTGANAMAPRTGTASVGLGAFGNVAADSGIGGVFYYEGTLTDAQILDWYHACYDARDIVDNAIGMTIFSVKRGTPGATWTESDGTGPDLSRTGSLTTVNRDVALWG